MCQVITFPTNRIEHTNAYENLRVFFDMCDSPESCKFYLETVESLASDEYITTAETLTLRRVGRQKYKELSSPKKPMTYKPALVIMEHITTLIRL